MLGEWRRHRRAIYEGREVIHSIQGLVAELADAHGLGPCPARGGGSNPLRPTNHFWVLLKKYEAKRAVSVARRVDPYVMFGVLGNCLFQGQGKQSKHTEAE